MESEQNTKEFVHLLTAHQEVLRVFVHSLLPNHADIMDLVQEVNMVLWDKRDLFCPGSNFGAWARQIARNKVMNHCTMLRKRGWQVLTAEILGRLADEAQLPESAEMESRRQALTVCLERLTPENRQLLWARYTSPEEMKLHSTRMGRSHESLRVTLFRLRGWLRECMDHRLSAEGGFQ
jgi:RNA polymerase sigma-70 factor, ECF subfamily